MSEKTIDLFELIRRCPETTVSVRAGDLGLFCRKLLAEARQEFERQQSETAAEKAETYLDAETVLAKLGISTSTLYRLGKAHVLDFIRLGGRKKYRLSDIENYVRKGN